MQSPIKAYPPPLIDPSCGDSPRTFASCVILRLIAVFRVNAPVEPDQHL